MNVPLHTFLHRSLYIPDLQYPCYHVPLLMFPKYVHIESLILCSSLMNFCILLCSSDYITILFLGFLPFPPTWVYSHKGIVVELLINKFPMITKCFTTVSCTSYKGRNTIGSFTKPFYCPIIRDKYFISF